MIQHKRFGRTVGLQSTVKIVRELKIMMRRDTEGFAALGSHQPLPTASASWRPSVDAR